MLLIFDGTDKVGKTSLINAVDKATKYQHIMIDRGPLSYLVYDKLLKRNSINRVFENLRDLNDLSNINHLAIYLEADEEDVYKRLKEAGEEFLEGLTPEDFFNEYSNQFFVYKRNYSNTVIVNTSHTTLEETLNFVLKQIDNVLSNNELIKLRPKFTSDEYVEYYPSYNVYSLEMLSNLKFDVEVDEPYYKMVEAHLDELLHKHNLGLINSRQIVYTSLDCITNIQYIPADDYHSGELHITQRSLNIAKHGYNDLLFFVNYINNRQLDVNRIYYNVIVPHKYNKYNFLKKGELAC